MPSARNSPPPPKSPRKLTGTTGALAGTCDATEGARDGDVVDVVSGGLGERPVLAPAGHPAVHESRIALPEVRGSEPEPLHHTGPEPLDQRVGPVDQLQNDVTSLGTLDIDGDRAPAAMHHVLVGAGGAHSHTLDPDHVGTEVGEQHRRERPWPEPGHLDDSTTRQRTRHSASRVMVALIGAHREGVP